ncbi:MAG: queuosine precursor transporter [Flaviaesturariibacter sp.]|nr:queuosine precursor transporter [Flaviaesturariibacter sp.]
MIHSILKDRPTKLFLGMSAFFVANALIAEIIGGKIFSLEGVLGVPAADISFLGQKGLSFSLTCGVLLWPLEFIMTDIVNEYYGPRAVRRISFTAISLILYAFLMFYLSMSVPPAGWWIGSRAANGVPDMQKAYEGIFGQGMWIIFGSIVAFGVSQLIDVYVFHRIKRVTGEKRVWLRATGSTLISQLIDSFVVLIIAFKLGNNWSWAQVIAIACMNYIYKFTVAVILTPVIYGAERWIDRYLGKDVAHRMKRAAMGEKESVPPIPAAG